VTFSVTALSPPVLYNGVGEEQEKDTMTHLGFEEAAMDERIGGNRGPRRVAALAVAAAVAVLATACGGSASTSTVSASALAQELAFSQCMRSKGVANFPDPNASGGFTVSVNSSGATINTSQAQSAYGDCRHLLPSGGPSLAQIQGEIQRANSEVQQADLTMVAFAQCMHTHGEPDFPRTPENP
jgi:hypothetical protein